MQYKMMAIAEYRSPCRRKLTKQTHLIISILTLLLNNVALLQSVEIRNVNASLGNSYRLGIVQGQKHFLVYAIGGTDPDTDSLRPQIEQTLKGAIRVICSAHLKPDPACPLIVTVTQKRTVVVWEAADSSSYVGNGTILSNSERTICLDNNDASEGMLFTVELSTCSQNYINYTLSVHMKHDFVIPLNKLTKAQMMPSSPAVYYHPQMNMAHTKSEFVFIQLIANPENCMIMSTQQPTCPVADTMETITNHGQWQTVSAKTGMTVPVKDFPFGFFLVFLLLPDDTWCNHQGLNHPEVGSITSKTLPAVQTALRRKSFYFTIREKRPTSSFTFAMFFPLGLFLTFTIIIFVIHFYFHQLRCHLAKTSNLASTTTPSPYHTDPISQQCPGKMRSSTDSIVRSRIHISELINSEPERLMVQSRRYFFAGILCASFYCVPVFQLILSHHKRLVESGNLDLCYFNQSCAHMVGMFYDFNHIFSNIGYIIGGLAFMVIVLMRQLTVVKTLPPTSIHRHMSPEGEEIRFKRDMGRMEKINNWRNQCLTQWDISRGVFVHHGLFYTMGFSLFMTGVMSSAYHICPNQNNFQFDTAFMYTIAALGCITIYTFRHPTYVSASMTFLGLAAVAASTVVGLLWDSYKFRLFFTVTHLIFLLIILVYIHYVGYVRVDGITVTEWKQMFSILGQKWQDDMIHRHTFSFQHEVWSPEDAPGTQVIPGPSRLIFPVLVVLVNSAALTMVWIMMSETNFASQVLAVYIINCSTYTVYYCVMKLVHSEFRGRLWAQPAVYFITGAFLWMWALSYFGDEVTLWEGERSPAESRAKNADCAFLGFYDSHDIWHFLSSAALLCSLMTLLTIDDDLIEKPKAEIPVF